MSEDPIGFAGGDYNLYRYVQNNPTKFTDPSGKIGFLAAVGIGAFIGGVSAVAGEILFNENLSLDSAGSAFLGGVAAGAVTVAGAGAAIVAGGSSLVGAAVGAISGLIIGSGVNLITDPSTIPTPIKPHTPLNKPEACE